jgi:glycosyltransferase involved in cell wall biosynthesis
MLENDNPRTQLPSSLFLVWGTPDQGPRSRVMANKLGSEPCFVHARLPRGALYVLIKYPIQAIRTMGRLFSRWPPVVFVQNPPLLAVLCVYVYCALGKAGYIIDAHSEAFLAQGWTAPPLWIKRFLARRAIVTIVTNKHLEQLIGGWGGQAMIIRDVPTTFTMGSHYPVSEKFNVALINTFAADEPLDKVLEAARALPDVQFYVTGKVRSSASALVAKASGNVCFTDFLADEIYYALLNAVDAVMCLTSRDHTMQRGACEALSLGKPIITSNWAVLRQYFNKGTVHVDNTCEGIRQGVVQMKELYSTFLIGIKELQADQQREWEQKIRMLISLIQSHRTGEI